SSTHMSSVLSSAMDDMVTAPCSGRLPSRTSSRATLRSVHAALKSASVSSRPHRRVYAARQTFVKGHDMAGSGSILGNSVLRVEDPTLLTGQGKYVDDLV